MRTIVAALADMAGARVTLASVEVGEEVDRQRQKLMLAALGSISACSGLALATLLVAVIFWDTHRVAALAGLTLVHLGCSVAAFVALRRRAGIREREKRLLIMRSTLAQLRVQVAAARIARSPGLAFAASIARFGRGFFVSRVAHPSVRYRTDPAAGQRLS